MPPKDKYTDPDLRDEVKEEIHQGDKGGAPGQWSARKAQMMASEYKKRGGGYTTDKKDQDESQQHLSKWTEEDWQTKEGSGDAKQPDGTQKRYLPKKAWQQMSEEEKKATDDKKQEGSAEGKQFVGNTDKAKESRQKANDEEDEEYAEKKAKENDESDERSEDESKKEPKADEEDEHEEAHKGQKRPHPTSPSASKKQKQNSGQASTSKTSNKASSLSKTGQDKDRPSSATHLPQKGQKVTWQTSQTTTTGTVIEIAYSEKEIKGKKVKASKEDPRIVLESEKSGKVVVHKVDAVDF